MADARAATPRAAQRLQLRSKLALHGKLQGESFTWKRVVEGQPSGVAQLHCAGQQAEQGPAQPQQHFLTETLQAVSRRVARGCTARGPTKVAGAGKPPDECAGLSNEYLSLVSGLSQDLEAQLAAKEQQLVDWQARLRDLQRREQLLQQQHAQRQPDIHDPELNGFLDDDVLNGFDDCPKCGRLDHELQRVKREIRNEASIRAFAATNQLQTAQQGGVACNLKTFMSLSHAQTLSEELRNLEASNKERARDLKRVHQRMGDTLTQVCEPTPQEAPVTVMRKLGNITRMHFEHVAAFLSDGEIASVLAERTAILTAGAALVKDVQKELWRFDRTVQKVVRQIELAFEMVEEKHAELVEVSTDTQLRKVRSKEPPRRRPSSTFVLPTGMQTPTGGGHGASFLAPQGLDLAPRQSTTMVRSVPHGPMRRVRECLDALKGETESKIAYLAEEDRAKALQTWFDLAMDPAGQAANPRGSAIDFQNTLRGYDSKKSRELDPMTPRAALAMKEMKQLNVFIALSHGQLEETAQLLPAVTGIGQPLKPVPPKEREEEQAKRVRPLSSASTATGTAVGSQPPTRPASAMTARPPSADRHSLGARPQSAAHRLSQPQLPEDDEALYGRQI